MKYYLIIAIVLLSFVFTPLGFAETLLLPKELLKGANDLGYNQINNYFEKRPGMVDPPYVYGCLSGDKELSAVFWAIKINSKNQYALILMKKNNILENGKFTIIYQTKDYPRGLAVDKGNKIDLRFFHYVEDLKRSGVGEIREPSILIYDMYDGVGRVFCYQKGKWLIRQYD